jgi:hypothetical protein
LQYTATPQAPLLISISDALSPSFTEVLRPGEGYVGGRQFFINARELTPVIPVGDIPTQNNPLRDPPASLLEALRLFFIGVAAGLIEGWSRQNPNRSMFVHPSRETEGHFRYFTAIERARQHWGQMLSLPEGSSDRLELIREFEGSYQRLRGTFPTLPEFSRIVSTLPRAINDTLVKEVNTRGRRKTPKIEWNHRYPWILVGGQSMDRGFTIKGLTVTYMPRGMGTGNADTLQQRARFLGYKQRYLGLCRIYLEFDVLGAFTSYVQHEEDMRRELIALSESGQSLKEWKRRFILSPDLRPCRQNVIEYNYVRGNFADKWALFPQGTLMAADLIESNRQVVDSFLSALNFVPDTSYSSSSAAQQHLVSSQVPLRDLLESITRYDVSDPEDSANYTGLLLQLSRALESLGDSESAAIYKMRPGFHGTRSLNRDGKMDFFQQGRTETVGGRTYPGDQFFRDPNRVSLQIHYFDIQKSRNGPIVANNVPLIALWLPRRYRLDWLTQEQPSS